MTIPSGLYEWEYTSQPVLNAENIEEWDISPKNTFLVGISQTGENVAEQAEATDVSPGEHPRPDGLIQLQSRRETSTEPISIFLEVKTGHDSLSQGEMGQYRGALGLDTPTHDDHGRGVKWLEIYRVLQEQLERTDHQPDYFLLREFTQYLAWFELE